MELPDGYVIIFDSDRKGVNINVTKIELVRRIHCAHCFEMEIVGTNSLVCEQNEGALKIVDGNDWCCWGKRDDKNGNVERRDNPDNQDCR